MNVGERCTVTYGGQVVESKVTYEDPEKACGYVVVEPTQKFQGTILSFKSGWFLDWWIVGLDNGCIVKILV